MPDFSRGQVVRVPFPYTDRNTRQHRPALVISDGPVGAGGRLLWVLMITSAANPRWPDDCDLGPDYAAIGLPIPSVLRTAKIATIEIDHAEPVGQIGKVLLQAVMDRVRTALGR